MIFSIVSSLKKNDLPIFEKHVNITEKDMQKALK